MRMVEDIIIKPIITEASMDMLGAKKYVFKVQSGAPKADIAHAVEAMFKDKVESVNTVTMKKMPKRMGVHAGYTSVWKMGIVTLTADSKTIEFFDGMQ